MCGAFEDEKEQTTFISKTMESVTRAIKRMASSFFSRLRKETGAERTCQVGGQVMKIAKKKEGERTATFNRISMSAKIAF